MPQDRYRRRSSSRSRSRDRDRARKSRRRRHRSSKSSDSSSSSRSRSRDKRIRSKDQPRRSPSRYRRSSGHSPRDRKRRDDRRRSSPSPAHRRERQHSKDDSHSSRALGTNKVLSGNFSEVPGLEYVGRNERVKKERSLSPHQRHSQDLDRRLQEIQSSGSSSSRPRATSLHPKAEASEYYGPRGPSPDRYEGRGTSPIEQSTRFPKDQDQGSLTRPPQQMPADNGRYRDQRQEQRPDYGIRVEVKQKPSPKRKKLDPSLVVIPRRKDEGLRPIFDRPEIISRTLEDDPELYPEKYERFDCWKRSPEPRPRNERSFSREREGRSRRPKGRERSPTPDMERETTVMMKPFTIFEKYEQSLRSRETLLQDLDDTQFDLARPRSFSQQQMPSLGLDSMLHANSDLRHDLEVRRQLLNDARSPIRGLASDQPHGNPSSDRRPVRERLGDIARGMKPDGSTPDFKKEVEELRKLDPMVQHKGSFFLHDDRAAVLPHERAQREERRPEVGRFNTFRGNYRGRYMRGAYRGTRGTYRGGMTRPWYKRNALMLWKHDKYDDRKAEREKEKRKKREKSDKADKKDKKEKKKSKKSKKQSPARKELKDGKEEA